MQRFFIIYVDVNGCSHVVCLTVSVFLHRDIVFTSARLSSHTHTLEAALAEHMLESFTMPTHSMVRKTPIAVKTESGGNIQTGRSHGHQS